MIEFTKLRRQTNLQEISRISIEDSVHELIKSNQIKSSSSSFTIHEEEDSLFESSDSFQSDSSTFSSIIECLQSTKLSNCLQCLTDSGNSSTTMRPLSSSSLIDSSQSPTHQINQIDSIIAELSLLLNEKLTSSCVCVQDYEATFVDDISICATDEVRVLRDNKDEWLYVEVISDNRCGFIPRENILDLKMFTQQLELLKNKLIVF